MSPAGTTVHDPVELLADVATTDPVAPPLLAAGAVVLAFSIGVIGFLAAGAVLDAIVRPFE